MPKECDKLVEVQEEARTLSEFVDFLRDTKHYQICRRHEKKYTDTGKVYDIEFVPILESEFERLFAEFFNIDLDKVEQERRDLLEKIRSEA